MWGLVALRLADEEFLPFNYLSYAHELQVCPELICNHEALILNCIHVHFCLAFPFNSKVKAIHLLSDHREVQKS